MQRRPILSASTPNDAADDDLSRTTGEIGVGFPFVTDDDTEQEVRELTVAPEMHGERLDRALASVLPEFSRSYAQQLLAEGCVTRLLSLSGPVHKASQRVRLGEHYRVVLRPTAQSQAFKPEPMPLDVVYEDEALRVIKKPVGLVVHPAAGNWQGTLLNGLLALDAKAVELPRAGIVHRLDKDTSGLMVVARTRLMMDALVQAIAARDVSRQYLAMAHRPWIGPVRREVQAAIGRDPRQRLRMAVVDLQRDAGKAAHTTFDLLHNTESGCVLRCTLHTGRTHQIRVHAAHIGHPLLADALYGGSPAAGMTRQALHAWRLAFRHPVTGQNLDLRAPAPEDLGEALKHWGLGYNALQLAP